MLSEEVRYKLLKLLEPNPQLSQREVARELGISLGKVNYCLKALVEKGWIKAEWGVSDNNRKARYYKLTAAGRKQLTTEKEHWLRITKGIDLVLSGA